MKEIAGAFQGVPVAGSLHAALNTMAMGNANAVEFGQAAHVPLAARSGATFLQEVSAPPRALRGLEGAMAARGKTALLGVPDPAAGRPT